MTLAPIDSEVKHKLFTTERRRIKENEIRIFEKLYGEKWREKGERERERERERDITLHVQPLPPLLSLNPPLYVAVCTVQSIRRIARIERVHGFMVSRKGPPALRYTIMIGQLLLVEQ